MDKKRILIVCTGNVARSQRAEGSALNPSYVRPGVIQVMREVGIDISHHRSKSVDEFREEEMDYVITVCDPRKPALSKPSSQSKTNPLEC